MPKKKETLKAYRTKRNFTKTPEPTGDTIRKEIKKSKKPIFVIQKHQASRLHYDFRLQIGDVLVSWAIPKGPSTDPRVKRLAIQTEDHPLDYAYFEGIIPEGYGAGEVMVWDIGTFDNLKDKSMQACLKEGRIEIDLDGQKLQGGYALIKPKFQRDEKRENQWLFFKMKDEFADARRNPVSTQDYSVLTGRTIKQIEEDKDSEIYE